MALLLPQPLLFPTLHTVAGYIPLSQKQGPLEARLQPSKHDTEVSLPPRRETNQTMKTRLTWCLIQHILAHRLQTILLQADSHMRWTIAVMRRSRYPNPQDQRLQTRMACFNDFPHTCDRSKNPLLLQA